jgi:hypothetical protein
MRHQEVLVKENETGQSTGRSLFFNRTASNSRDEKIQGRLVQETYTAYI